MSSSHNILIFFKNCILDVCGFFELNYYLFSLLSINKVWRCNDKQMLMIKFDLSVTSFWFVTLTMVLNWHQIVCLLSLVLSWADIKGSSIFYVHVLSYINTLRSCFLLQTSSWLLKKNTWRDLIASMSVVISVFRTFTKCFGKTVSPVVASLIYKGNDGT